MTTIVMETGNENETVTYAPVEMSLTVSRAIKFGAGVREEDMEVLNDLIMKRRPIIGNDPELGEFAGFDCAMRLVVDEEAKNFYVDMGDDPDEEHEALLTVHFHGETGNGGSLFFHVGRKNMLWFWQNHGEELVAREKLATGKDARTLSLVIAVLQYVSGDDIDLAPMVNEWASSAGRKCGVQLLANLLKAA